MYSHGNARHFSWIKCLVSDIISSVPLFSFYARSTDRCCSLTPLTTVSRSALYLATKSHFFFPITSFSTYRRLFFSSAYLIQWNIFAFYHSASKTNSTQINSRRSARHPFRLLVPWLFSTLFNLLLLPWPPNYCFSEACVNIQCNGFSIIIVHF